MANFFDYLWGNAPMPQVPPEFQGLMPPAPMQGPPTPAVIGPPSGMRSDYAASYPTLGASLAGAPYQNPATVAGSVGGNVGNVPMPQPRPQDGGQTAGPPGVGGQQGAGGKSIMDALRGVKTPPPPEAQSVRTPSQPQLAPIKGGEFINLLASLGVGPQELMRLRLGGGLR
jgi:hypothetical protein